MEEKEIAKIVRDVVYTTLEEVSQVKSRVPIAVSNRHVHLSPAVVERLFGRGYQLKKLKDLSQPGQFAGHETVTLIGPKGKIDKVRVLGPARGETQVEISLYDGYTLGVTPPVRDSGKIDQTPGITLQGPKGQLKINRGLICAARHIHMHTDDALAFQLNDGERVSVKVEGPRGVTYDHVLVRVSPKYKLEMHIDIDEANAAQIINGQIGFIVRQ